MDKHEELQILADKIVGMRSDLDSMTSERDELEHKKRTLDTAIENVTQAFVEKNLDKLTTPIKSIQALVDAVINWNINILPDTAKQLGITNKSIHKPGCEHILCECHELKCVCNFPCTCDTEKAEKKDVGACKLKTGDVVRLKSGGPYMTIELIISEPTIHGDIKINCRWFDDQQLTHVSSFLNSSLVKRL